MSSSKNLQQVFSQVDDLIQTQYRWISTDSEPADYYDCGLNYQTTAQSIIDAMLAQGDLEVA